jgi:hypothetical protein
MTNPTITIVNVETNEVVEREMNAAELKQYELDQAYSKGKIKAEADEANAKTALLERLGITADEAALLLS